jgi:hypothetical protein
MQIPCVYIPGPAPAVSVANTSILRNNVKQKFAFFPKLTEFRELLSVSLFREIIFSDKKENRSRSGYEKKFGHNIVNTASGSIFPWFLISETREYKASALFDMIVTHPPPKLGNDRFYGSKK